MESDNILEHTETSLQSTWMVANLFSTLLPIGWILILRNKNSLLIFKTLLSYCCMLALQVTKAFKHFSVGKTTHSRMRHKPTASLQKVPLINVGTCSDLIKPILINTLHDWDPGSEVKKYLTPGHQSQFYGLTLGCRYGGGDMCCKGWLPPAATRVFHSHLHLLHRPQEENIYSFGWWLGKFYFQFIRKEFQWILIYHTLLPLEQDISLFFNIL